MSCWHNDGMSKENLHFYVLGVFFLFHCVVKKCVLCVPTILVAFCWKSANLTDSYHFLFAEGQPLHTHNALKTSNNTKLV